MYNGIVTYACVLFEYKQLYYVCNEAVTAKWFDVSPLEGRVRFRNSDDFSEFKCDIYHELFDKRKRDKTLCRFRYLAMLIFAK